MYSRWLCRRGWGACCLLVCRNKKTNTLIGHREETNAGGEASSGSSLDDGEGRAAVDEALVEARAQEGMAQAMAHAIRDKKEASKLAGATTE